MEYYIQIKLYPFPTFFFFLVNFKQLCFLTSDKLITEKINTDKKRKEKIN